MEKLFVRFATLTAKIAGKPWTFIACLAVVVVWAASGPVFKFNETWQLVINTGTTIITFLMVFQAVAVSAKSRHAFNVAVSAS